MPCRADSARGFSFSSQALRAHHTTKKSVLPQCRTFSSTSTRRLRGVPVLRSWESPIFERAYKQNLPARLPRSREHLPPACSKWFIVDGDPEFELLKSRKGFDDLEIKVPSSSELRTSFWAEHDSTFVPLEVTTKQDAESENEQFERIEAPLKMLLAYLSRASTPFGVSRNDISIYLAQCDLSTLPESLQADVPVPRVLQAESSAGIKGDIYASSLWLGRPPTYTPLHRDPNPNLFIQLAGQKTIRFLPPEVGDALYHDLMMKLSPRSSSVSSKIRGEEMMAGPQKKALHDAVWDESSDYGELLRAHGFETTLGLGDTLFTPKGWWHSVKGVGKGITASVNWWFR